MYPRSLSCCAPIGCCLCCPGMHTVDVASPEAFVPVMLGVAEEHNLCPEELRGLLWMEFNIAPETLITLDDVEWRRNPNVEWDGLLGFKGNGNRTTDASCAGTCLTLFSTRDGGIMRFSTSPSGRWIAIPLARRELHLRPAAWRQVHLPRERGRARAWGLDPSLLPEVGEDDRADPGGAVVCVCRAQARRARPRRLSCVHQALRPLPRVERGAVAAPAPLRLLPLPPQRGAAARRHHSRTQPLPGADVSARAPRWSDHAPISCTV
mmetsp:Transcript_47871/g.154173  ORF Transcript_47871/g.154173 Transcript_47871/m.154173 type:complete len:265 (-) Transcript_47871:257-1051(-)